MTYQVFVPLPRVHVRDPRTYRLVPEEGVVVAAGDAPIDQFWARRVADGDGRIVTRAGGPPVKDAGDDE